jgi:outer membrane receptor protein involved in Fe transport
MKRISAISSVAMSLASSLALLVPAELYAQGRDVGVGTNPAATTQTQTTPNGQNTTAATPDSTGVLDNGQTDVVTVIGSLDALRNNIVPNLGATSYGISQNQIADQSQGEDASFNQTLLRVPGFAQDSYGQLHVRGEHANLQFRINDIILPEGIAGFGQELDTRVVDNLQVITGSLPAQYGINTAGIIDIHTKSSAFNNGDEVGFYGGSYNTDQPSFETAGTQGKFSYYFTGDFLANGIGIENPDGKDYPIHDHTEQYHGFGYMQYVIDNTSRLSLILSGYDADFQIPNNPGQAPAFGLAGVPVAPGSVTAQTPFGIGQFSSSHLDENQNEQNDFAVLAYQKSAGKLNFQQSIFIRNSSILYTPDNVGDEIFNGVASRDDRYTLTGGAQLDASYQLTDSHTLRAGYELLAQHASNKTVTDVFPTDADGVQTTNVPESLRFNQEATGDIYGAYIQDEWHVFKPLTINFGVRYDRVAELVHEGQASPRLNAVYQLGNDTVFHAGYSRYFTPPPFEGVQEAGITQAANTTNAAAITQNSPDKAERSNYFDAGATQTLFKNLQLGIDGYYKRAVQQLDEGQFGTAIIESPFNYRYGEIFGLEGTLTYVNGGFEAYANAAYSEARGRDIDSSQFLFDPDEFAYIQKHYIYLDHDQTSTVSAGLSYLWKLQGTRVYGDMLYGSGLRDGFANEGKVPAYYNFNVGVEQSFRIPHFGQAHARFDIVNLADQVYQLRNGSGVGVEAPQYGQRRGIYGGISIEFGPQPASKDVTPPVPDAKDHKG